MVVTEISTEQMVTLLVTVIAPLIVGLLTKASWSANLKAILLLGISAAIGVAQGFLAAPAGTTWAWQVAVVNGVIAWVIAVATHYGLWKPTGITAKVVAIGVADPPGDHEVLASAA